VRIVEQPSTPRRRFELLWDMSRACGFHGKAEASRHIRRGVLVPLHSDFDSLKSILAKNRTDPLGHEVRASAASALFCSTGHNHCAEVLAHLIHHADSRQHVLLS
jgi:hypothetical protein